MPVAVANKLHAKKMSLLLYFKSYIEDSLNKVRPEPAMGIGPTG